MERYKHRPCRLCRKRDCPQEGCEAWQDWFLESWEGFNAYSWRQMDSLGRQEPTHFIYELPHLQKSPCEACRCRSWCDRPCSLRLQWWDHRIRRVERRLMTYDR